MSDSKIISKTGYTTGFRCPYATYLYTTKRHLAAPIENELILINGHEFGQTAASFMEATYEVEFSEDKEKMVEETQKAISEGHKIIAEASFIYNRMFCSVDILLINEDGTITFYEVKSASEVKEINKFDVAFQYEVLTGLGYEVKHAYIMHANGEYYFNIRMDLLRFLRRCLGFTKMMKVLFFLQKNKKRICSSKRYILEILLAVIRELV